MWGRAGYARNDDNHRTRCFRFADELRARITHGVRPGQDIKKKLNFGLSYRSLDPKMSAER